MPFVLLLAIILAAIGLFFFVTETLPNLKSAVNPENEDALSMYKVPSDVLAAVAKAKSTNLPVLGIRADVPGYKIPVLMYHYVENVKDKGDTIRISLNTPPYVLDNEIKTLKDAGFTFINASDLADILDGIKDPPNKPVVLTFDDGYRDFYTDAFPILKKYNVKAVEFVVSGFLNGPNYLTTSQLMEISKNDLIEIGDHTLNHVALAALPPSTVLRQIVGGKIQLETMLGIPITTFAYPYGSFDLSTIQLAKSVGFRTAFSTVSGTEVENYDRFYVNRLRPGGRVGQALLDLITK